MRVKTGFVRHRQHVKVLKRTKGFRMSKRRLIQSANEADLHAGQYAYIGRRLRKRDLRRLWITRINAGLGPLNVSYSRFINKLKSANIILDRKILADLVVRDEATFKTLVAKVFPIDKDK